MENMWEHSQNGMVIYQIQVREDNFTYLVQDSSSDQVLAIDPGESERLLSLIEEKNLHLKAILITHQHRDHVEGIASLKSKTNCVVIGSPECELGVLDQDVIDGEECSFGPFSFLVMATPGHTLDSQVYFFSRFPALFSGDTLFLGGTGRLFEGTIDQMYASLKKIVALPPETKIFCGHNYYEKNLLFAQSVEPDNAYISEQLTRHRNTYVTTTTLLEDKRVNPFLRLDSSTIHQTLGFKEQYPTELEVLAELRARRNEY